MRKPVSKKISPVNRAFVRAMYKKGAGNDKQGKDAGNRTLCPYRNFSQAINDIIICVKYFLFFLFHHTPK